MSLVGQNRPTEHVGGCTLSRPQDPSNRTSTGLAGWGGGRPWANRLMHSSNFGAIVSPIGGVIIGEASPMPRLCGSCT
jgi:hypothetical protein